MYTLHDAKVVKDLEQGSAEWLLLRRTSITSTDIASTLPKVGDTQNCMVNFLISKNSNTVDLSGNIKVQKGKDSESGILQNFIHHKYSTGLKLPTFDIESFKAGEVWTREIEFEDKDGNTRRNYFLSSHDGSIYSSDNQLFILEAKWSGEDYHYKNPDYILPRYLKQVAHHLLTNNQAVGCYLIISDCENRTVVHYLTREHPGIKGAIDAIIRIGTSIQWVEKDGAIYWSTLKGEEDLKADFLLLAERLAKIHSQTKHLIDESKQLEANIKAAPYAAHCIGRFPEHGYDVKLEMQQRSEFISDKYIRLLEHELRERDIALPNKMQCIFNMSYQTLKIVKI